MALSLSCIYEEKENAALCVTVVWHVTQSCIASCSHALSGVRLCSYLVCAGSNSILAADKSKWRVQDFHLTSA